MDYANFLERLGEEALGPVGCKVRALAGCAGIG